MWVPPRMPKPLLQEFYWPDSWKVAVVCLFLNCTQRKQVEPVVDRFFARYKDAEAYVKAYEWEESKADIVDLIRSLGFGNRRAERIYKFSCDFMTKGDKDPRGCHGVGEYASACFEMLFLGKFGDAPPNDHALKDYWVFVKGQNNAV